MKDGCVIESNLYILQPRPPFRFYDDTKIHKDGIPLCPVVSFINHITYQLTKHFVDPISSVFGNTNSHFHEEFSTDFSFIVRESHVEDTKELLELL